jgi:hypothetical protein
MPIEEEILGLTFNIEQLQECCDTPEDDMLAVIQKYYPHAEVVPTRNNRLLIFVNNNSGVLGIAHMDGTMPAAHFYYGINHARHGQHVVWSPYVDDRMGVYTLIHLIRQVGANADLLFTVDEEHGQSTGQFFKSEKQYNWMFQFDRMGLGAVHYQYDLKPWKAALKKHFIDVSHGIASDISKMGHLGAQGVNIGTGYYEYTGLYTARCILDDLSWQVGLFRNFYDEFKDTPFLHPADFYDFKPSRFSGRWNNRVPDSPHVLKVNESGGKKSRKRGNKRGAKGHNFNIPVEDDEFDFSSVPTEEITIDPANLKPGA